MQTLIADVEADGLLRTVKNIWQLSIKDPATGELTSYNAHGGRPIKEGLARLKAADRTVWHHGLGYDRLAIEKVLGPELAPPAHKIIDTLVLSRLGNPEREGGHSLENWGRITGRHTKVEHEDWSKWSPEMEHRCNIDVEITAEVYKRLEPMLTVMPKAVELEHKVAHFVALMIDNGYALDVDAAKKLAADKLAEIEPIREDLQKVFPPILVADGGPKKAERTLKNVNRSHPLYGKLDAGTPYCKLVEQEFNPGSRVQIANRLIRKYGWKPSKFTASGQSEISETVLQELDYPEAELLVKYLTVEKAISQIMSEPKKNGQGGGWLHHVTKEGRVHPNLNPNGTVTGRPSCSAPNLQQVDTDKAMRSCWIPKHGWKQVGVDAEGLELRTLSHYLWRFDNGNYAKALLEGDKSLGTDVHSMTRKFLGMHMRDPGAKRIKYAWLYGAGDPKLGLIWLEDVYEAQKKNPDAKPNFDVLGIKPTKDKRKIGKAIRHHLEHGFVGLGELVNDVKKRAREQGFLRGLDGRKLRIRSDHSALNTVLQSAGAIIMKQAIATFADRYGLYDPATRDRAKTPDWGHDYAAQIWVHDEVQFEAREAWAATVGKDFAQAIVDAGPALNFRCPLAGDSKIGANWAETH